MTTTTDQYTPMDISSLLDSEEMIAEYLTAAAEDENPDVLLLALADVAKARGMAQVAKAAGLGRESLYKALAPGSHPRFSTVQAVLRALNVNLSLHVSTGRLSKAHRKTTAKAVEMDVVAAVAAATRAAAKKAAKPPAPAKKRYLKAKEPAKPAKRRA